MNNFLSKYPTFRTYPITWIIIFINLVFFLVQTITGGSTNTENLVRMGAKFDYAISELSLIHI